MNMRSRLSDIKAAQKASVVYRTVAPLVQRIELEHPEVRGVYLNRAVFTPGKTLCRLYMYSPEGEERFQKVLKILTLYIPSIRKAVARTLNGRYAPDILFVFDAHHAKVLALETLIEQVRHETVAEEARVDGHLPIELDD